MAISRSQTNEAADKKAKLYPAIILCVLVGAVFCVRYSLTWITFAIGFSVQYATWIAYETKGNEFVQAIEVYHEQNGRFPYLEEASEIGGTLGIGIGSGKSVSYKFFYSLPNTTNPAMDNNNELIFPYIFFQSPNMVFETCFFNSMKRSWDCTD